MLELLQDELVLKKTEDVRLFSWFEEDVLFSDIRHFRDNLAFFKGILSKSMFLQGLNIFFGKTYLSMFQDSLTDDWKFAACSMVSEVHDRRRTGAKRNVAMRSKVKRLTIVSTATYSLVFV